MCSSPESVWYPQRSVCWATATRELVQRKLHEKHKKDEPGPKKYHPLDGVSVWVSQHDLTPEDNFLD